MCEANLIAADDPQEGCTLGVPLHRNTKFTVGELHLCGVSATTGVEMSFPFSCRVRRKMLSVM